MTRRLAVAERLDAISAPTGMVDDTEQLFDILPWDSEAFGFAVARIADTVRSPVAFAAALRALRARGVRLAYFSCPWTDAAARDVATGHGGRLVDRKLTYGADCADIATGEHSPDVEVVPYTEREPDDTLFRLARSSGQHSRFRVDPAVEPRVFAYIYDAWIQNSVAGTIADAVYVARLRDATVGLVTVGERNGRGDIGLLAVDDAARRRGVGRALVGAARSWAVGRGFTTTQVVTQGDNIAACALYESCGYHVERAAAVYHCWL